MNAIENESVLVIILPMRIRHYGAIKL